MTHDIRMIIPVRSLADGKRRLETVLSDKVRQALIHELFEHVLKTACDVSAPRSICVATADDALAAIACSRGCAVSRDDGDDLNAALAEAARMMTSQGADAVLVLHADLPCLRPDDIRAMMEARRGRSVIAAADKHGAGTNAVLLSPPDVIAFAFGTDSLRAFQRRAESAGAYFAELRRPGLAFDLDTPDDLANWRAYRPPSA